MAPDSSVATLAPASTLGAEAAAEDAYFGSNPAPKDLPKHVARTREFVNFHAANKRRVVLVTSGGTTVPLEKQTVRFLANFSAGTRGATSAEYFLEAGYAVIFLHREFSLQPYSRHYSHATDCFLDFLQVAPDGQTVVANPRFQDKMLGVLRKYVTAKEQNLLLMLPFVTITDYLHELRAISLLMRPLGPDGLLYLAAAVSDFFIPPEQMAEHKIQSTDATDGLKSAGPNDGAEAAGAAAAPPDASEEEEFDNFDSSPAKLRSKRLVINLDPVPKFLKNLVDGWAPEGMIVSFKLETDPEILVHKAKYALNRYQHHLVIGNLLSTRKWEVVFVSPDRPDRWIRVPIRRPRKSLTDGAGPTAEGAGQKETGPAVQPHAAEYKRLAAAFVADKPVDPSILPKDDPEIEIESLIIPAVQDLHDRHIESYREKHRS